MSNVNNEYERDYILRAIDFYSRENIGFLSVVDEAEDIERECNDRDAAISYFRSLDDERHPLLAEARRLVIEYEKTKEVAPPNGGPETQRDKGKI
jgi:hypothetical protein